MKEGLKVAQPTKSAGWTSRAFCSLFVTHSTSFVSNQGHIYDRQSSNPKINYTWKFSFFACLLDKGRQSRCARAKLWTPSLKPSLPPVILSIVNTLPYRYTQFFLNSLFYYSLRICSPGAKHFGYLVEKSEKEQCMICDMYGCRRGRGRNLDHKRRAGISWWG